LVFIPPIEAAALLFFFGVMQASLPLSSLPTLPPPFLQAATASSSLGLMAL
jgi:hypothetical protein